MRSNPNLRRWRWMVLCGALMAGAVAAQGYVVRNGTVAGGGQVAETGRFKLISTIGEPAMGTTSASRFTLTSGFPATIGDRIQGGPGGGRIFQDGFED